MRNPIEILRSLFRGRDIFIPSRKLIPGGRVPGGCYAAAYPSSYPTLPQSMRALEQQVFGPLHRHLSRSVPARILDNIIWSLGNAYETALLTLEFNNTNIANIGDATGLRGSSTAGSFYIALHTADPGEAGDQTSSEATFTGYARVAVARSSGGWTISGNSVVNAAAITFAQNTGSDQTVTHWSLGVASSSTSMMLRYGPFIKSGSTWLPFDAFNTGDKLTIIGHGFVADDRIVVAAAYDSTLPTGATQGTVYYVGTVSGNDVTLSTTATNANPVVLTADGAGVCIEAQPLPVRGGIDSPQFAAGQFVAKSD